MYAGANLRKSSTSGAEADAKGWGGYVGVAGSFKDLPWKPYFDLSVWYLSGDEDGSASGNDDDEGFISHGNTNRTMIYENLDYGFGLSSNYTKIQLTWGFEPPMSKLFAAFEDYTSEITLAWYKANSTDKYQDNTRQGLPSAANGLPKDASEDLGIELDMKTTYNVTEDLTVVWGSAYLFGSDFVEDNFSTPNSQHGGWAGRTRKGQHNGQMTYFVVELEF